MKKIFTTVLFLLSAALFSESDFQFYSYGEFAYYPNLTMNYTIPEGAYFSTDLAAGLQYKNIYVEARQHTYMVKANKLYFSPFEQNYYVTAGFIVWAFGVEYEHLCSHGVDTLRMRNGWYDKISINFDSRRLR